MAKRHRSGTPEVTAFDLQPGRIVARKYDILAHLGTGWEGEVYLVRERSTGIERAAKFFFPQRNPGDRTATRYARKLHKLHHCPIVIQYHTQETITWKGIPVTFLVSDFVEGELLSDFLARQPGKRLQAFPALHLLHALASGIECIHQMREYHGDLHSENIIIQRYGLGFDLKLLDLFHWGAPRPENIHDDVIDLIRIFYEALGGRRHYARLPPEIKAICCGLKRSLILKKFKTAGQLREYLETMQWN
ncbi:MAG TPA: protein kinase [Gammaproteobacteria bacterium]|nr:protein kinase [Gammaproteobacteria bacterium]